MNRGGREVVNARCLGLRGRCRGSVALACASVGEGTPTYAARMNEILMRAVVEAAAFLEMAADDVIDPDVAVKELESMAYLLGQLNESEKRQLVAFTQAEADRASSVEYREFLRQFPEAMGL
jgi:hypothetical protein